MQDVGKKFTSKFGDSSLMEGLEIENATVPFEKSADRSLPNSKQSIFDVYESSKCFSFIYVCQKFGCGELLSECYLEKSKQRAEYFKGLMILGH